MSNLSIFLRQVRNRSAEHQKAMGLLFSAGLVGQMIAVLRQELDSMVRVIFLLAQDLERREILIDASVSGEQWTRKSSRFRLTDRDMVDFAQSLHGWTQSVYKFGCAFIHLSNFHDYSDRDPLSQLTAEERRDIFEHCRHYHGGPAADAQKFEDLVPYLPRVLDKISSNLDCYLEALENCEVRGTDRI